MFFALVAGDMLMNHPGIAALMTGLFMVVISLLTFIWNRRKGE